VTHAIQLAVQLDGLRIVEVNGKVATRDEHMYGEKPKWTKHMRRFEECGVVKEGKNGKAGSRGIAMMFVGYAADRESDSYNVQPRHKKYSNNERRHLDEANDV